MAGGNKFFLCTVVFFIFCSISAAADVNVNDYGVIGDGVANDAGAIQAAIDYVNSNGGGTVFLNGDQQYYINDNIELKSTVTLRGEHENIGTSNKSAWDNLGCTLILNSTKQIIMKSNSTIHGVLLIRQNQALPETDATNFAGRAIYVDGSGCTVKYCAMIGFDMAVETNTTDTSNLTFKNCNIDCNNGIKIVNSSAGTVVTNCHIFPYLSSSSSTTPEYQTLYRYGNGFHIDNVHGAKFNYNFCHAHDDNGYLINNSSNNTFNGCGADNLKKTNWTTPTGNGYKVTGDSEGNTFNACQTASQDTGYHIDIGPDQNITIKGGAIWAIKTNCFRIISGDVRINNHQIRGFYSTYPTTGIYMTNPNTLLKVHGCLFRSLRYGFRLDAGLKEDDANLIKDVVTMYQSFTPDDTDFTQNGITDYLDFRLLAADYQQGPGSYTTDISGPGGTPDGKVDFYDLLKFTGNWLK